MPDTDAISVLSSENRTAIPIYPLDVFLLTDAGEAQLHGKATRLPPQVLAVMVLLDGKASVGDLEQKLPQQPAAEVRDALRVLVGAGLARAPTLAETEGLDFSAFFEADTTQPVTDGAVASAGREAEDGVPQLSRDGYYVSIARQAASPRAFANGKCASILVVEDDTDLAMLVRRLLEGAGFEVSVAATRAEVLARLRKPPLPDLVVLDVQLPDTNGFDILQRLKAHAALKAIPVVMLTAEATRESVMRGLVGGADGYITKPFDRGALLDGLRAVLGLGA